MAGGTPDREWAGRGVAAALVGHLAEALDAPDPADGLNCFMLAGW